VVNNSPVLATQINAVQQMALAGNASIGGVARWDMRGTGNALDMAGFNLTKVGDSYIALVGTAVNNPGNITLSNGTLGIQLAASLNGSSANTLTVQSNAMLEMYQSSVAPTWTLVLNGGSTLWSENGSGAQNTWAGPVTLNGAATLRADAVLTVSGEISGLGSLTKISNNIATLTASNSYAGNTTVSAGTLALQQATLATNSTITVASNAVLALNFVATNTVAALVLDGVSQAPGVYDSVSSAPYLTGTGALLIPSAAPAIPNTPTNLVFSAGGGNLTLSWPSNYVGWILQSQTNLRSVGLKTNWFDLADTHTNNSYTFPIDKADPTVFFRLVRTNQP
jgi:autotransporter-associated beta strand protein